MFCFGFLQWFEFAKSFVVRKNQTHKKNVGKWQAALTKKKRVFTKSETSVKYAKSWISFVVFNWCLGITLFFALSFQHLLSLALCTIKQSTFLLDNDPTKKVLFGNLHSPEKDSLKGNLNLLVKCYHLTTSWCLLGLVFDRRVNPKVTQIAWKKYLLHMRKNMRWKKVMCPNPCKFVWTVYPSENFFKKY